MGIGLVMMFKSPMGLICYKLARVEEDEKVYG